MSGGPASRAARRAGRDADREPFMLRPGGAGALKRPAPAPRERGVPKGRRTPKGRGCLAHRGLGSRSGGPPAGKMPAFPGTYPRKRRRGVKSAQKLLESTPNRGRTPPPWNKEYLSFLFIIFISIFYKNNTDLLGGVSFSGEARGAGPGAGPGREWGAERDAGAA